MREACLLTLTSLRDVLTHEDPHARAYWLNRVINTNGSTSTGYAGAGSSSSSSSSSLSPTKGGSVKEIRLLRSFVKRVLESYAREATQVSPSLKSRSKRQRFQGPFLYTADFFYHVEMCIRQISCSLIISYDICSIAHDHYTDIYPKTLKHIYPRLPLPARKELYHTPHTWTKDSKMNTALCAVRPLTCSYS